MTEGSLRPNQAQCTKRCMSRLLSTLAEMSLQTAAPRRAMVPSSCLSAAALPPCVRPAGKSMRPRLMQRPSSMLRRRSLFGRDVCVGCGHRGLWWRRGGGGRAQRGSVRTNDEGEGKHREGRRRGRGRTVRRSPKLQNVLLPSEPGYPKPPLDPSDPPRGCSAGDGHRFGRTAGAFGDGCGVVGSGFGRSPTRVLV